MALTEITVNTVPAKILIDGYQKGGKFGEGFWRRIRYKVEWDKSDLFLEGLIGTMTSVGGGIYPIPHQYHGNANLYCVSAHQFDTRGVPRPDINAEDEASDKLFGAGWALIEAEYAPLPFPVNPGDDPGGAFSFDGTTRPFRRVATRFGMRTYTVPETVHEFSADGTSWTPATGFGEQQVFAPQIEYVFTYEMYPSLPHGLVRALNGSVNDGVFFGCARGTLLFTGGATATEPSRSPLGGWLNAMEFSLTWQGVDWNKVINPQTGDFVLMRRKNATYNYPYMDFGVLVA